MLASRQFKCTTATFLAQLEYTDLPPSEVDLRTLLDGIRDGGLRSLKGQLVSEREIQVDGHPGRDLMVKSPSGLLMATRSLVARDARRTRIIIMTYTNQGEAFIEVLARRFFDSVRVHAAPPMDAQTASRSLELRNNAQKLEAEAAQLDKELALQAPVLYPEAIAAKKQEIARKREQRDRLLAEAGRLDGAPAQGQAASAGSQAVRQENSAQGLESLFRRLRAAQLSGDTRTAADITRGLLPSEPRLRLALRVDVPAESVRKIMEFHRELPSGEAEMAGLLGADAASTEVRVHSATTEQLAAYAAGSVAYQEFPGGAKDLAKAVLRPNTTFYEVELVRPGAESGMTYHLLYWDGEQWAMLGPMWRAVR
jgi:hypothetical protein